MVHFGWVVFFAFVAYVFGVIQARNINAKDRQYWLVEGRRQSDELAKIMTVHDAHYGSSQFVAHGTQRYGKRFIRILDHLELGGFNDEA